MYTKNLYHLKIDENRSITRNLLKMTVRHVNSWEFNFWVFLDILGLNSQMFLMNIGRCLYREYCLLLRLLFVRVHHSLSAYFSSSSLAQILNVEDGGAAVLRWALSIACCLQRRSVTTAFSHPSSPSSILSLSFSLSSLSLSLLLLLCLFTLSIFSLLPLLAVRCSIIVRRIQDGGMVLSKTAAKKSNWCSVEVATRNKGQGKTSIAALFPH